MNKSSQNEQNSKREFLERIARMYYVLEMTQKDIAQQMGVGRSSVARFLSEAKSEGVVQFHITSKTDNARRADLERKLISKYKLVDAVVVKNNINSLYESTVVSYLNSTLPFQGSLGIGGGTTLYDVGQFLHMFEPRPNLKIVQMIGGFSKNEKEMPSTSVIQNWAQALETDPIFLPASAIVEDKETKEFYLRNKNIEDIYQEIRNIDISIVGIGNIDSNSAILRRELVEGLTSDTLKANSIGDINLHYYNKNGEFSMPHISDRVIGASPLDMLRIPLRIGLAYGEQKSESIKAALKGRLINILATTDETAKLLL